MKSKEEMIEVIAEAINDKIEYDYIPSINILAEAALKALCGALPEEDNEWHSVDILHELKQWGK